MYVTFTNGRMIWVYNELEAQDIAHANGWTIEQIDN